MAAFPMNDLRHTGVNLCSKLEESLEINGLAKKKVVCCVRDDAANMISATNNLDVDSFQCAAHFINLIIHDSLELIKPFIDTVKEWTKECRKTIGKQILIRHQIANNLPQKQLVMVRFLIFIKHL
jgi:hypothetical protein